MKTSAGLLVLADSILHASVQPSLLDRQAIDALREYAALLDRPSGNSQEGWQLVPVELTEEMRKEGFANSAGKIGARALWRAMLAAAPTAAPAEAFGKSREVQANLQDKPLDRLLGVWWRFPDGRWLRDTDARFDGTDTTGAERVVITGSAATPSPQREEGESIQLHTKGQGAVDAEHHLQQIEIIAQSTIDGNTTPWKNAMRAIIEEVADVRSAFATPPVQPAHDKGETK